MIVVDRMGWRKRKGGSGIGFSNCLRVSLLCILGLIALECETVPVAEIGIGAQSRIPLEIVEGVKTGTDLLVGDQTGKSRDKRSADKIEPRYLGYDGLDEARKVILNGTFADGRACITGQDPLSKEEVKKVRPGLIKDLIKLVNLQSEDHLYNLGIYKKTAEPRFLALAEAAKEKCESKSCNFDFSKLSFICGPISPNIENGKSCLDGSTPKTENEFSKTEAYRENKLGAGYTVDDEAIASANKDAQQSFGKNCKSGKCYYHIYRGNYICSSSSLKPFALLISLLVGFYFLRVSPW